MENTSVGRGGIGGRATELGCSLRGGLAADPLRGGELRTCVVYLLLWSLYVWMRWRVLGAGRVLDGELQSGAGPWDWASALIPDCASSSVTMS